MARHARQDHHDEEAGGKGHRHKHGHKHGHKHEGDHHHHHHKKKHARQPTLVIDANSGQEYRTPTRQPTRATPQRRGTLSQLRNSPTVAKIVTGTPLGRLAQSRTLTRLNSTLTLGRVGDPEDKPSALQVCFVICSLVCIVGAFVAGIVMLTIDCGDPRCYLSDTTCSVTVDGFAVDASEGTFQTCVYAPDQCNAGSSCLCTVQPCENCSVGCATTDVCIDEEWDSCSNILRRWGAIVAAFAGVIIAILLCCLTCSLVICVRERNNQDEDDSGSSSDSSSSDSSDHGRRRRNRN